MKIWTSLMLETTRETTTSRMTKVTWHPKFFHVIGHMFIITIDLNSLIKSLF